MKIVWDEPKRLANCEAPADFAELDESFFETALLQPARTGRWMAIGLNVHNTISVVFARQGRLEPHQHASCQQEGKGAV